MNKALANKLLARWRKEAAKHQENPGGLNGYFAVTGRGWNARYLSLDWARGDKAPIVSGQLPYKMAQALYFYIGLSQGPEFFD